MIPITHQLATAVQAERFDAARTIQMQGQARSSPRSARPVAPAQACNFEPTTASQRVAFRLGLVPATC